MPGDPSPAPIRIDCEGSGCPTHATDLLILDRIERGDFDA